MYISFIKAHGWRGRLLDPTDIVEADDKHGEYLVSMNVAVEVKKPDMDRVLLWDEGAKPKKASYAPSDKTPGAGR